MNVLRAYVSRRVLLSWRDTATNKTDRSNMSMRYTIVGQSGACLAPAAGDAALYGGLDVRQHARPNSPVIRRVGWDHLERGVFSTHLGISGWVLTTRGHTTRFAWGR